jgi:hypothetical protein
VYWRWIEETDVRERLLVGGAAGDVLGGEVGGALERLLHHLVDPEGLTGCGDVALDVRAFLDVL